MLDVEHAIAREVFFTAADGVLGSGVGAGESIDDAGEPGDSPLRRVTFCVLTLTNGANVVGVNYGAIDPAAHDPETGRRMAYDEARAKVFELLGFRLRDKLAGIMG
jgi:hypothetical protein